MILPSTKSKADLPIIKKARGKYVWDIEGNKYLDFTGSNLTTVLGYRKATPLVPNTPGVSSIEQDLTSLLRGYTNTSNFRYFKNGHNAVDCAVRLAQHILRTIDVAYIGYHGTSDSYVWTTDNDNGVPVQFSEQAKTEEERNALEIYPPDILVFESRYAEYADKIDARIKVCDCLKSGVRAFYETEFGGRYLEIPYDFMLYGKSIANGSALAVMTGKDELMEKIDEIYYSTTFGCNQDAMAECIRTIQDFEKIKTSYFDKYNYAKNVLPNFQSLTKTQIDLFLKNGIIFNGYWQVMQPHSKKDIDSLGALCREILD